MAEIVITVLTLFLIIWWLFEYRRHRRYLNRIPIRVHINGSRGKSSVTRLIGAVLREGGIRTITKTTGTNARFIFPDGSEEPIVRIGPANIKEQRWVVRRAAKLGAQALVTECMAIDPELQWVLQHKYINPTVGVLTNARADHLDMMGPTIDDATKALASVLPHGKRHRRETEPNDEGICFTAEREKFPLLQRLAKEVGCRLVLTEPESVSDEEMEKFSYIEHKENVALVLAVAEHFGIDRATALRGMWAANPDPGVLRLYEIQFNSKKIRFANAFAANDPDSTMKIFEMLKPRIADDEDFIIIANSRADRVQRAEQLGKLMASMNADAYILVGALLKAITERMQEAGIQREKIYHIPDGVPKKVAEQITEIAKGNAFVIGIGNIGGAGHAIADFFEEQSENR